MTSVTSQLPGLFFKLLYSQTLPLLPRPTLFIKNWSKNVQPFGPGILNLNVSCSQGRQRRKTSCLRKPSGASLCSL